MDNTGDINSEIIMIKSEVLCVRKNITNFVSVYKTHIFMANSKNSKDRSGEIGMGAGATGAAAGGGTMVALTGGSASAAAITHALATVGGVVGGGMAAGVGVLIG